MLKYEDIGGPQILFQYVSTPIYDSFIAFEDSRGRQLEPHQSGQGFLIIWRLGHCFYFGIIQSRLKYIRISPTCEGAFL